jgi:hypothetical protein
MVCGILMKLAKFNLEGVSFARQWVKLFTDNKNIVSISTKIA